MPSPLQISLSSPGDAIAAVPHLLGYHPTDSLVIVSLDREAKQVVRAMRADLPPENQARLLAEQLVEVITEDEDVVLMVIGGTNGHSGTRVPYSVGVKQLSATFTTSRVAVLARIWAATTLHGAACRRYDDPSTPLTVADSQTSVLAAECAALGLITRSSRQAIEVLLSPAVSAEVLARRARLLERMTTSTKRRLAEHPHEAVRHAHDSLRQAVLGASSGSTPTDDQTLLSLAALLTQSPVRDIAAVQCIGEHADAAERLWLHLTREIPAPFRASPAALLAVAAYARGDGSLANIAVQTAREADPSNTLASLMDLALRAALPPKEVIDLLKSVAADLAETGISADGR